MPCCCVIHFSGQAAVDVNDCNEAKAGPNNQLLRKQHTPQISGKGSRCAQVQLSECVIWCMTTGTVLLQVQSSIGHSDYVRRDQALKGLIQPLAGEYGMHNGQPQGAPCST